MDRPMIQIYMGLLAGSILYFAKSYMGITIAAGWLIIYIIILLKAKFKTYLTIVILGFTLLSFVNCNLYFSSNEPDSDIQVRITSRRSSYYIGTYENKNLKIIIDEPWGAESDIELGRKYVLKGNFQKKVDYTKGVIGNYIVDDYKRLKKDFICIGYDLKDELYDKLSVALDEEGAGVILALSCGDSSYIDYERRDEFNLLGISHIISVSGLHVALIYGVLKKICGSKSALLLLFVYVIFTGGKASTVRAFIMIVIMVMSTPVRRKYEPLSALATAAFILLLMKPYAVLDVGYVLSFLAVLGILTLNKKLTRKLYKLPNAINTSLSLTLSAMVYTLPYMIFIFKKVSLGGIISNLILIPFYTFLLIVGMGLLVFMRIPLLFTLLTYIATSILTIIRIIEGILINKLPLPLEFTYLHGIIILVLYLSYLLIKRGVNSLKYLPLVLMILVIKETYTIFPEINFIAGKRMDIVQVIYGNKNILISPQKVKIKSVYADYGVLDRIYDEFEDELILNLGNEYAIYFKNHGGVMKVEIAYKKEVTKFIIMNKITENSEDAIGVFSYGNYDIIEVEKNEDTGYGHYYGTYKIIGRKVYPNYVH